MKFLKCVLPILTAILLTTSIGFSQQLGKGLGVGESSFPAVELRDGTGVLNQSFNLTGCGLDYTYDYVKVTDRQLTPTGTGLPTSVTISGIPSGAVIEKALLYWAITVDVSGVSGYTFNGNVGSATMIGEGNAKCWYANSLYYAGYQATQLITQNYRADVTQWVSGNGTYAVDLDEWDRLVDGLGLIVVYSQPGKAWEGTLLIDDGCITHTNSSNLVRDFTGMNACVDACDARAFAIVTDFAPKVIGCFDHFYTIDGQSHTVADEFFQIDEFTNLTLSAGQLTMPFEIESCTISNSTDCFDLEAMGFYYRTYSCSPCAQNLVAQVSSTDASCGQCDGDAAINVSGGCDPYQVTWSPNSGSGPNLFNVNNLCVGNYTVDVVDDSGCIQITDSFTINGTVPFQVDSVAIIPSSCTVCDGVVHASVSNQSGNLTYELSSMSGSSQIQINDGYFDSLCIGNYVLNIYDAAGCTHSDSVEIIGISNLQIDSVVATVDNGCAQHCNGNIQVYPNNAAAYSIDGIMWQPSSTFSGICAGSYQITMQDSLGCTNTATVLVDSLPLQVFGGDSITLCENEAATLEVSVFGGEPSYSYTWSPVASNSDSLNIVGQNSGSYSVVVEDALGCTSDTILFEVSVLPPLQIAPLADVYYCTGDTAAVTANVSGGDGNYSYEWTDGSSGVVLATSANLTLDISGSGTISLIVNDGCTSTPDTASFSYTQEARPHIDLELSNVEGCAPFSTTLALTGAPGGEQFNWIIAGFSTLNTQNTLNYQTSIIGCEDVELEMTTSTGCLFTYSYPQAFCVHPNPIADFAYDPESPTTLHNSLDILNLSDAATAWSWSVSENATIINAADWEPSISYYFDQSSNIDVCLYITDINGCSADTCQIIEVLNEPLLYVPNSFTPNGDGVNDVFLPIVNAEPGDEYRFLIFDRWGLILYDSEQPEQGWDGTYSNYPVQQDTYIWKLTIRRPQGQRIIQKVGHVNLLR